MYYFLINPSACSGRGKTVWKKVKHILDVGKIPYESYNLKSRDEATEIAWRLSEPLEFKPREDEINHLIVLGGDGTLNAVLQGIRSFRRIRLSCITAGSGNDFSRDMGLSRHAETAVMNILYAPNETLLDYGELVAQTTDSEGQASELKHRFLISCGVGFDANICEEANRSKLKFILNKAGIGKIIYILIGLKQIFGRSACGASLIMKDTESDEPVQIRVPKYFFAASMIHTYEGGGVPFCPDADPTDGLFDICLVENMSTPKIFLALLLLSQRKHYMLKRIRDFRCKEFQIHLSEPQWFHVDGETPCKVTDLTMVCKSGLRFVK